MFENKPTTYVKTREKKTNSKIDLLIDLCLTTLVNTIVMFRDGHFILVEEAGDTGENHQPMAEKSERPNQ